MDNIDIETLLETHSLDYVLRVSASIAIIGSAHVEDDVALAGHDDRDCKTRH